MRLAALIDELAVGPGAQPPPAPGALTGEPAPHAINTRFTCVRV